MDQFWLPQRIPRDKSGKDQQETWDGSCSKQRWAYGHFSQAIGSHGAAHDSADVGLGSLRVSEVMCVTQRPWWLSANFLSLILFRFKQLFYTNPSPGLEIPNFLQE